MGRLLLLISVMSLIYGSVTLIDISYIADIIFYGSVNFIDISYITDIWVGYFYRYKLCHWYICAMAAYYQESKLHNSAWH